MAHMSHAWDSMVKAELHREKNSVRNALCDTNRVAALLICSVMMILLWTCSFALHKWQERGDELYDMIIRFKVQPCIFSRLEHFRSQLICALDTIG